MNNSKLEEELRAKGEELAECRSLLKNTNTLLEASEKRIGE
jgi:hypothetical protein